MKFVIQLVGAAVVGCILAVLTLMPMACALRAAGMGATPATTQPVPHPAPATQPAFPYWLFLRLRYPHRTMENPFATPRDFDQQV